MHKFAVLTALLIFSFGFTSAFADDVTLSNHVTSFSDFVTTQDQISEEIIFTPMGLNTQDSIANMLAVLLLGIPFGVLVYRMSDSDPIPIKYAKLSSVTVLPNTVYC